MCNQGTLDDAWAEASRDLVIARGGRAQGAVGRPGRARAPLARRCAHSCSGDPRRPTVHPPSELELVVADVRDAWDAFESVPDGDLALADHLELHAEELAAAVRRRARSGATAALAERDDAWGPLAARIAAWCEAWDDVVARRSPWSTGWPPPRSGSRRTTPG